MSRLRKQPGSTLAPYLLLALAAAVSVGLSTDLASPPRFDGAGYAVLGEALASGRGYREIDRPGALRHAHFPPGYPAALALLWRIAGRSVAAAHGFSAACMVASVLLAWRWFTALYPPRQALILGLALALNWTWGRVGGAIQSEPFYILWEMLAVLAVVRAGRSGGVGAAVVLGIALAACVLIRHVGVCLVLASAIELGLRRRVRALAAAVLTTALPVLPWIIWLLLARRNTQVGLLAQAPTGLAARGFFYLQRLPDQITGPFVEVATVFWRSPAIAIVANLWAAVATGVLIWGWIRALRTPRRRLAGLVACTTLALLWVWPFTEAGRFLIPLLPMVLVGATEGIAGLLCGARRCHRRDWAVALVLAASVPYTAYSLASGRAETQRRTHADFDAACQWMTRNAPRPGPVLTRHPGEVYWQTGRQTVPPDPPDPESIEHLIDRMGVAYLLIDDARYANAESNPLSRYVERFPRRVALVWERNRDSASIRIYEVLPRPKAAFAAQPADAGQSRILRTIRDTSERPVGAAQ
jgi:hypothetical protein